MQNLIADASLITSGTIDSARLPSNLQSNGSPTFASLAVTGPVSASINWLDDGFGKSTLKRVYILGNSDEQDIWFQNSANQTAIVGLTNQTGKIVSISQPNDWVVSNRAGGRIILSTDPNYNRQDLVIDSLGSVTLGGLTAIKDTGKILNVHLVGNGWKEEDLVLAYSYKQEANYTPTQYAPYLWCTTVNPSDRSTPIGDPVIQTNFAFRVEKDMQTFGFVGTGSDPQKQSGGGAILMGQGFMGTGCPPIFSLTGTMISVSDNDAKSSFPTAWGPYSSRPMPAGNRAKYYQTDNNAGLYEDTPIFDSNNNRTDQAWQFRGTVGSIGSYPTTNNGSYGMILPICT